MEEEKRKRCKYRRELCLNCPEEVCFLERTYDNTEYCRSYYQKHKEEAKERVRRNRAKKRIEEKGYEMAIYI